MIFADEIEIYRSEATRQMRGNTCNFLTSAGISRLELEGYVLRRFPAHNKLLYTSTVPRGLAGSTSDIDLMVVLPPCVTSTETANFLFFGGRRIGVKGINSEDLSKGLAMLRDVDPFTHPENILKLLPLKWMDLERAVNGCSFEDEIGYLCHLEYLSRWGAAAAMSELLSNAFLCALATRAGRAGSRRAYIWAVRLSLMDMVMAACGRVQSNSKWTAERWRVFRNENLGPIAADFVAEADALIYTLDIGPSDSFYKPLANFCLRLSKLSGLSQELNSIIMRPSNVEDFGFLPGARLLSSHNGVAVIDELQLNCVMGAGSKTFEGMTASVADTAVRLIQLGLLSILTKADVHV
jgi:hypothetical protein